MHRPAVRRWLPAFVLVLALADPLAAQDAGPVAKPLPSNAGGNRLPAPTGLTVMQDAQGAIVVSWTAVAGAVRYNLGRAVGTEGFRQAVPPSTVETKIVDTRVTAGVRHVYTVTAIDAQGVASLRATSEVFTPSRPYQANTPPPAPTDMVAQVLGDTVQLRWVGTAPNGVSRYDVRRNHVQMAMGGTMPWFRDVRVPPGNHEYEVRVVDVAGYVSPATKISVTVGAATSGGGVPEGDGIAAEDAGGTVLVNMAPPVTLRAGATHSLSTIARAGWTSLSPSIASVTADGTVSARAAGIAQLATLGTDAGGAVRVTVVRVRVTP